MVDHKRIPKQVIVGVSGGIAAYKACTVVRQLTEASHRVRVIPTESALRFVGAATFEALSGEPVCTDVFRDEFVTMDMGFDAAAPAPEHQPGARASDCGAGPIGFAGTVRKEAVVKAAGLTTLAGDDFGGGPTMPMMPGTWTHDQGVFDEHR